MGKGLDTGTAFLTGVLSKITDPEQKAAAEKLLANPTFVTEIGNGVEGQAEIDRTLSRLRTQEEALATQRTELAERDAALENWRGQLGQWWEANKAAVEAARRGTTPAPTPTPTPTPTAVGVTPDQFEEQLRTERAAFLGYQRDQNQITREHYNKFKEIIDLEPLIRHPKIAEVGLIGVYELVHKDRLEKHKTDTAAAAEEKIRADERSKVLAAQAQMPYPSPTGVGSGSPLDALKPAGMEPVVDAAVAHYNRLQAERTAPPA